MKKDSDTVIVDDAQDERWAEDVDIDLPAEIAEAQKHGKLPEKAKRLKVMLSIRELPDGEDVKFKAALTDTLREVFEQGAKLIGKPLLPPSPAQPLDILRCKQHGRNGWGEALTELDRPLWLTLAQGCARRFGIEYVLAIKINTRWDIAPTQNATPKVLLSSFGFDPAEFSLYRADSASLLPPDTPLELTRGEVFEAQKDGRYGASSETMRPSRGSQTIEDDIEAANEAGIEARLINQAGQRYVELRNLHIPSPPWSHSTATILIAVPATYPMSGLDAFYVELTLRHSNGPIPYQQSTAQIDGRHWGLISWHYAINRPWNPRHDDLISHVEHCRGFFLRRGVTQ